MKRLAAFALLCAALAVALWPDVAIETPAAGNAAPPKLEARFATRTLPPAPPPPAAVAVVIEHGVEVRLRPQSLVLTADPESAAADEARDNELVPAEPVPPAPAREPPPPAQLSADD